MLFCSKCNGRVLVDRTHSDYGHLELFCLKCGKRWEAHRDTLVAKVFKRIERKRELGYLGRSTTEFIFS